MNNGKRIHRHTHTQPRWRVTTTTPETKIHEQIAARRPKSHLRAAQEANIAILDPKQRERRTTIPNEPEGQARRSQEREREREIQAKGVRKRMDFRRAGKSGTTATQANPSRTRRKWEKARERKVREGVTWYYYDMVRETYKDHYFFRETFSYQGAIYCRILKTNSH